MRKAAQWTNPSNYKSSLMIPEADLGFKVREISFIISELRRNHLNSEYNGKMGEKMDENGAWD